MAFFISLCNFTMCVFIKAVMEVQTLIYIVMGQKAMIFPQQRNKRAVMANINLLLHWVNKIYDVSNRYNSAVAQIIPKQNSAIVYIIDIPTNQAQCPNQA